MQRATVVYRVWAVSPTHTNYRTERLRTATETLLTGGRRALVWVHEWKRAPYRTQSDGRRTKSTRLHGEHEISGDWSEMTCILNQKVDTMFDGTVRNHKSPGKFSGYLAPLLRYLVLTAQPLRPTTITIQPTTQDGAILRT